MKRNYYRITILAGLLSLACTTRVSEWILLNVPANQYSLIYFHQDPLTEAERKQNQDIADKIETANIQFNTISRSGISEPYYGLYYAGRLFSKYETADELVGICSSPLRQEIADELHTVGFDLNDFGTNTFVVNGCPLSSNNLTARELIDRFLEQYKSTGSDIKSNARERMASALARANSIDYGEKLTREAMRELVDSLFACEEPNYSPSGKPVVSIMMLEELEKRFR